jgi:hypothetical protein
MHHGVSVRPPLRARSLGSPDRRRTAPGRAGFLVALAVLVSGAVSCAIEPPPIAIEDPLAAAPQHCRDEPGPIEILAADVVIAIDRSTSTRNPTGLDLDGDGVIGEFRESRFTDTGDSLLAAEVSAVERLIEVARLGGMRFAIVSYSGRDSFPLEDSMSPYVDHRDARVDAELTDDRAALEAAVARVAQRGSDGASSFWPAMRLAVRSLRSPDESQPQRRRRVLFLADTPWPLRYAPMDRIAYDDPRMEIEARRALASGVSFHSIGIGEAALSPDGPHALAQIAGATGGTYRVVPDPRNLYCQMLAALGARDPS